MNVSIFEIIFIVHYISTLIMTGAIWLSQLSSYPLLVYVGRKNFIKYEHEHIHRISSVAWFIIYVELITAILLFFMQNNLILASIFFIGLLLILIIYLATSFIQYPIHMKLEHGFDKKLHSKLVNSNWIRTIAWTIRALLLTYVLIQFLNF